MKKLNDVTPQIIESCEGNSVRARLIELEHEVQPGSRKRNAVHIEVYDEINIGNLKRYHSEPILSGDKDETVDHGSFLCGRNIQNIQIYHSDTEMPTCKKCIELAARLTSKGLRIFIYNRESWKVLQDYYYKGVIYKMVNRSKNPNEFIKSVQGQFQKGASPSPDE